MQAEMGLSRMLTVLAKAESCFAQRRKEKEGAKVLR
jgi:hypothetical protein